LSDQNQKLKIQIHIPENSGFHKNWDNFPKKRTQNKTILWPKRCC